MRGKRLERGLLLEDPSILSLDAERPVYLYGAGAVGNALLKYLRKTANTLHIIGFLDSSPTLSGKIINDLKVVSPDTPEVSQSNALAILATGFPKYLDEMEAICRRVGLEYRRVNVIPELPPDFSGMFSNMAEAAGYLESLPEIREAMELWDDDQSRLLYKSILRGYVTRGIEALPPLSLYPQYFHPLLSVSRYHSFVDIGAAFGDTLDEFRAVVGDEFESYYAFEPTNTLDRFIAKTGGDPRFQYNSTILSDAKGELPFVFDEETQNTTAHIGDGGIPLPADTLDNILVEHPVTFIKADIEGGELRMLTGARRTISSQQPAIAISTYHRIEHQWKIPLLLKQWLPSHSFYYGYHCFGMTDTVCYALPPDSRCYP